MRFNSKLLEECSYFRVEDYVFEHAIVLVKVRKFWLNKETRILYNYTRSDTMQWHSTACQSFLDDIKTLEEYFDKTYEFNSEKEDD